MYTQTIKQANTITNQQLEDFLSSAPVLDYSDKVGCVSEQEEIDVPGSFISLTFLVQGEINAGTGFGSPDPRSTNANHQIFITNIQIHLMEDDWVEGKLNARQENQIALHFGSTLEA